MKWSRSRSARLLAVGATAALLLTACSGGDTGSSKITLTIAYWGDFGLKDLVPVYEKSHPNIKINLNEGEYNAQHEALSNQLNAGSGAPDIAAIDEGFIVGMRARTDQFVNLLDKGAADYESKYLPWKWAESLGADADGNPYQIGLGTDVGGLAMCYRTDLFAAAGLPTDREAVGALWPTWDDFIKVGQQYVTATGKKFVDNATNVFTPILGQQDVGYFTTDEKLVMDGGPKVAFETTEAIIDAGLSANVASFSTEWDAAFTTGDFAVLACPAWMTGHIRDTAPDTAGKWDIATMPGGGGNWGGSFLTIPSQGAHLEESWELLQWLVAPEQQLAVFDKVGNLPSQPALYEEPAIQDKTDEFFSNAPTGLIFSSMATKLEPQYQGVDSGAVRVAVENVLQEIQKGNIATGSDAWSQALSEAEAAVTTAS